jgi:hypothetical protein
MVHALALYQPQLDGMIIIFYFFKLNIFIYHTSAPPIAALPPPPAAPLPPAPPAPAGRLIPQAKSINI